MSDEKGKYVYTWNIENFSLCALTHNQYLDSPKFKADSIGGSEWFLCIYPRGHTNEGKSFMSCYLDRTNNDDEEKYSFTLTLTGSDGEILKTLEKEKRVIKRNGLGTPQFLALDELHKKMESWEKDILTLQCVIFRDFTTMNNSAYESVAWTKIGVDRCCFKWNVDIPDTVSWKRERDIYISENSQLSVTLTSRANAIVINFHDIHESNFVSSKLVLCKISILNLEEVELISKNAKHLFDENDASNKWEFPDIISKCSLLRRARDFILNNTFTLKFEVSVSSGKYLSEIKAVKYAEPSSESMFLDHSILAFQEDLRNMLETDSVPDAKLRVGNQVIPVNKFILRARSPVFRAMFEQNMLENETGIVEIKDLDAETINLLLEFIYTGGNVKDLNIENAKELLVAADKYHVPSLSNKCSLFLISHLAVENVCEVYAVADMVSHANLKLSAMDFIEKNRVEVIMSDTWSDWMVDNDKLAIEILFKLAKNSIQ